MCYPHKAVRAFHSGRFPSYLPKISVRAFQLNPIILIFWKKFARKRIFLAENRKSEHHQWILYIRVSLGTKFQLAVLVFWTKFTQKGYFRYETEKVETSIAFCIFELD